MCSLVLSCPLIFLFHIYIHFFFFFFFQAEDGIRDLTVTGVQTCALPISIASRVPSSACVATEPRERMTFGWITPSCAARNGAHAASSSASGFLLPGGRHLTVFKM